MLLVAWPDESLDGRLSVEFDGQVHHVAPLHEAERRRVGPSPGDIDAHGTSAPYNLVVVDRPERGLAVGEGRLGESVPQQRESLFLLILRLLPECSEPCPEHGIPYPEQHRFVITQRVRLGDIVFGEGGRGIVEVDLIEYAMLIVVGQQGPIQFPVFLALLTEPHEIGLIRQLVGAQSACVAPDAVSALQLGHVEHPSEHKSHVVHIVHYREDACRLQVIPALYFGRVDATLQSPFAKGGANEHGVWVGQLAPEGIIHSIGPYRPFVIAHRHDIHALAREDIDLPCVLGHAGDDVLARQRPRLAHATVLYPYVAVVLAHLDPQFRVLDEDRGTGLSRAVHDLTLVAHEVLYGKHRRDNLPAGAKMIELSSLERQHHHLELVHCRVVGHGVGAQRAAELSIKVVGRYLAILLTMAPQRLHRLVAQQPHADVGEVEMVVLELLERFDRGLLQHAFQVGGMRTF